MRIASSTPRVQHLFQFPQSLPWVRRTQLHSYHRIGSNWSVELVSGLRYPAVLNLHYIEGIERYTVILDILELEGGSSLEDGCRKFSIAINMKKDSAEEPILASCTTPYYYPPIEYPELPLATLATTPYLPDIPLQMSPSFQNGHTLSAWGDNGYHGLQSSFVQYPDLVDTRFDTSLESDHSAYSYPSF